MMMMAARRRQDQLNRQREVEVGVCTQQTSVERGDGEGAPIHMPIVKFETVENHRMYCLMPSADSCSDKIRDSGRNRAYNF